MGEGVQDEERGDSAGGGLKISEPGVRLEDYVVVLREIAEGHATSLRHWPDKSVQHRVARELLRAGLISDAAVNAGTSFRWHERLVVSPEGALALVDWTDYLANRRLWRRAWRVIYQWLLVLVGAISGGVAGVLATRFWPPV